MRTKYCPHCCSEKIHREEEANGSHYHECEDCDETWEHHEKEVEPVGLPSWQDTECVVVKSNN